MRKIYIINGIAYAGGLIPEIEVEKVIALDDMMLLLTFNTGEKRLYDASDILKQPAFNILNDIDLFKQAKVEHGVLVWQNGDIDISPETLYTHSIAYQDVISISK